jgi:protein-tyrosine kinase
MSRIEEALEKAARLRNDQPITAKPAEITVRPVALPPPIAIEEARVTNQLLVAATAPHTPVAEEYRKLKSILVRLTKGECFANMLMVTSSISCEGKSITSLNLAITLAQEYDHTVLLVDADLRKPSIHTYLDLEPRVGLSECLMDGVDIKDALLKTGIGKLSLLPAGRQVPNPTEIFSSQQARDLLFDMKHRYDDRYIIIDTPPVLPFAETRSISACVDGIVLVVREGAASLDNVTETMDCLKGTNILGIVYNEATEVTPSSNYQYYRQGYAQAV